MFEEREEPSGSLLGRVASGLYSYTVGSIWGGASSEPVKADEEEEGDDPDIFVNVEFLNRQANQLIQWASKIEKQLHSEASLKRQLRGSTEHSEEDIELLLAYLHHSGKMAVVDIGGNSESTLCKLADISCLRSKKKIVVEIT